MTRPTRFLTPMLMFIALVAAVAAALYKPLLGAFMANPVLNGLIIGALILGVAYVLRQLWRLRPEVEWIENFNAEKNTHADHQPQLLAPLASMMRGEAQAPSLTTVTMRSLADSVAARLDERREISRYLVGLLVFLGLLGTFWGLLATISAIGDTIAGLTVEASDITAMFDSLKAGLEAPLSGMGTAFSSSLFGLAGSLVLGFLDLQLGQAQNRFYTELEDWLASHTKLGRATAVEGDASTPAYIEALMAQTTDSIEAMERHWQRSEQDKREISTALAQLADTIGALAEHMRSERGILQTIADGQQQVVKALSDTTTARPLDAEALAQLRGIDGAIKRLHEQQIGSQTRMSEDMHAAFRRFTKAVAAMIDKKPGDWDEDSRS